MVLARWLWALGLLVVLVLVPIDAAAEEPRDDPQYAFGEFSVPRPSAGESVRSSVDVSAALSYLEGGALAWSKNRGCVSCHTNGTYLAERPSLGARFGAVSSEIRRFFVSELDELKGAERTKQRGGVTPTQITYIARGLAEWDAHVAGKLSPETSSALELMFEIQLESGAWGNVDCWPPFESDEYHGAVVGAMAAVTAPGWLKERAAETSRTKFRKTVEYLQRETPPHDYARVWLLRAASRIPELLSRERKSAIVAMIMKKQRPDGGWALRSFAAPEAWGRGNRAVKLRGEREFSDPPSDGHQTGVVVLALLESGLPASDARIARGVAWLKRTQRESGRWWTRSLNTDKQHYITYSGTMFPLLALAKAGALERISQKKKAAD